MNEEGNDGDATNNKYIISRKDFLKLLSSGAGITAILAILPITGFGGFLRPIFEIFRSNTALASQKKETLLIVFPVPGYPLLTSTGTPTFGAYGIPNYDPEDGTPREPLRGMPWSHTIVIKGRLVEEGDPDKGISGKQIWWLSSYGPRPREGFMNIAKTKKNGMFIAFMRNNDTSFSSRRLANGQIVVWKDPVFGMTLQFPAPNVDRDVTDQELTGGITSRDPVYYHSNFGDDTRVEHHSLAHRTSLTVKVDHPDGNITPGQLITFTATLRDEDGIFLRNGIEPNAYFNVEDVDSIDITKDPLRSVLLYEMEGRVIHFRGTGIVPIKNETGPPWEITTAITDKNGNATFKAFAPNTVGQKWTYQAHYKTLDTSPHSSSKYNRHKYVKNPNRELEEQIIDERSDDPKYFHDADSPLNTFDTKPQEWFDRSQGMQPVRSGNMVIGLIDGPETFSSMVGAISTARSSGHYIYMLNWWIGLNFELIPGNIPPGGARSTRLFSLLANAVTKGAQVRAMLWDQVGTQNTEEVRLINLLANGAAILDNNTLNFGSHHQKILIVKGEKGLIGFCGGVDFHPDRITVTTGPGTPTHDVHCRIEGPAAWDLLQIFNQRWTDHPGSGNLDIKKGVLRGLAEPIPSSSPGKMQVQIARTYGNGSAHAGIRNRSGQRFYSFAPGGERTAERLIFHAIRQAQSFIYMEEQYLISMDASIVLRAQLPKIQFLIILIPHSSISDLPRSWELRKRFIDNLRSDPATRHKVVICYRKPAGVRPYPPRVDPAARHTHLHSKMFIFDDRFAIIGSANSNNRGYNHDSEVVAGILYDIESDRNFARELRIRLWQEHLNLSRSDVIDPLTSARHWFSPSISSSVGVYERNAGRDSASNPANLLPISVIDPSGG